MVCHCLDQSILEKNKRSHLTFFKQALYFSIILSVYIKLLFPELAGGYIVTVKNCLIKKIYKSVLVVSSSPILPHTFCTAANPVLI